MVQMNWFAGQKLRHRCREKTHGQQGGKVAGGRGGGGGVMNWEIGIDIYPLMCIKWVTNENLLYKKINKIKFKKKKRKSKLTKYISGMSFPCNRSQFIMSPSIYPVIIPCMFHHLRKEKL